MNPDTFLEEQIKLANGSLLRIRPLQRGEERPLRELYARLSPRTRYLRFFSDMPAMSDSLVRLLADVDDARRLALVVELEGDGRDVVALGNVAVDNDGLAEMGVVVADAWQRRGIGAALVRRLLDAAELRGHRLFVAHCLCENDALRRLLDHVADVVSTSVQSGVLEIGFVRRRERVHRAAHDPKRPVKDLFEQAYERILSKSRETARR